MGPRGALRLALAAVEREDQRAEGRKERRRLKAWRAYLRPLRQCHWEDHFGESRNWGRVLLRRQAEEEKKRAERAERKRRKRRRKKGGG